MKEKTNQRKLKQCAICGEMIPPRREHNAEPVVEGICCDKCNRVFVVRARMRKARENRHGK